MRNGSLVVQLSDAANGNVIAENDDHGGTFNSQITLDVNRAGQLRVVVTSFAPGATGWFEVRVR